MSLLMAAIYDRFMRSTERACFEAWRRELLSPLTGDVLEIGAGTGRNLDHYPRLDRLVLAEPDRHMRAKLVTRTGTSSVARSIDVVPWTAEALDAPDASFDAVVSTLVLCSVEDVDRSLREIRRVLRPSGKLVFLEHVVSDRRSRRVWQERLEPFWRPIAGNCHLCRDTARALEDAGFTFDPIVRDSARKALPIVRATIRGYATAPA
jgi:ubiquinone/menaquinone biosynthesis C-methylase UbiE